MKELFREVEIKMKDSVDHFHEDLPEGGCHFDEQRYLLRTG